MHDPANAVEEALAKDGRLIEAVKLYRKRTGAGLYDAKTEMERARGFIEERCPHCDGTGRIRKATP